MASAPNCSWGSNRHARKGPEVPMHPSDSPADRRDQENRAPAETPPSLGGLGQGKPSLYRRQGKWCLRTVGDPTYEQLEDAIRWVASLRRDA